MKKIFLVMILCAVCCQAKSIKRIAKLFNKAFVYELGYSKPNPNYQLALNYLLINCSLRGKYLNINKDINGATKADFMAYLKKNPSEVNKLNMLTYLENVKNLIWASKRGIIPKDIYNHFSQCIVDKNKLDISKLGFSIVNRKLDIKMSVLDSDAKNNAKIALDIYNAQ